MKVSQAVDFHLQYHQANSKKILSKLVSSSLVASLTSILNSRENVTMKNINHIISNDYYDYTQ